MQSGMGVLRTLCLLVVGLGVGAFARAEDKKSAEATLNMLKEKLTAAYPQVVVDSVAPSPAKGWYQATSGNAILYISEEGRYAFAGELLDLHLPEPERDLTEGVRKDFRVKLIKELAPKDFIIYPVKAGQNTKAIVTAFVDADCDYCHKLHQDIGKLAELGIELRYLAFPRGGVGSPTYTKMVSVWCSENRSEALSAVMKHESIPAKECANPVANQFLLGQKLAITGTPALFFEDGTVVPGYMPAEQLAAEAIKHRKAG